MFWINFKRIFRSGFISFWRNGIVSLSAVMVMIITLFVISSILLTSALFNEALQSIKDKVDVNVYFTTEAPEEEIMNLKKTLETLPEVKFVEYVSRDQALLDFREDHKNDQKTLEALDELSENPLGAVLNIKAIETSQYEGIANYLDQNYPSDTSPLIDSINYFQNKEAIEKLNSVISAGRKLGAIISILFVAVAVLITLNTVRLIIYGSRDEIKVMRLVGASHIYVTGPFIITGAIYGAFASILTLILLYPFTYWVGPTTQAFFGLSVFSYYTQAFAELFMVVFFSGILIGSISSFFAIKRYLKER